MACEGGFHLSYKICIDLPVEVMSWFAMLCLIEAAARY